MVSAPLTKPKVVADPHWVQEDKLNLVYVNMNTSTEAGRVWRRVSPLNS